jgi:hypothetical protein
MSMPFDATLKDLGRDYPADFLAAFDRPPARPFVLLNVDLSTVTTAADLVVGLGDPVEKIVHIDFQSSAAAWKHADVLVYNTLLYAEYHVPVHSIVVLLRPQAAHANLNGAVRYSAGPGCSSMDFTYGLVRLWEKPAADLLAGALGTTPLAMLGALPAGVELADGLTAVAQQLIERLEREAGHEQKRKLLTSAFVLTGLRVQRDVAREIFRGVHAMRDSDTYLAILDEGREEQLKEDILRLGRKRLGPPEEGAIATLKGIADLERLRRLLDRLLDATTWQDLLDTP